MKKIILILLIGVIILSAFPGCSRAADKEPIKCWMTNGDSQKIYIQISSDDTEKILSLLNEGEWTKEGDNPGGRYVFKLRDGKKIYYSLSGRLYDEEKDLYLYLPEEDWVYINRILLSQAAPPVDFYGPMSRGYDKTISEVIDEFLVNLEEADRGGSLIIDHIFGGDVELAKQTMDSELFRDLFETPYIMMERFFDHLEWRVSLKSEHLRVSSSGIRLWIQTEQKHSHYDAEKIISDKGEYYTVNGEYYTVNGVSYSRRYIDLGGGIFIFFDIDDNLENREQKNQKLLDYVFSIRNCVPDWQATPIN